MPQSLVGKVLNFRLRASRDGFGRGDQQNDVWLGLKHANGPGSIDEFLVGNGANIPKPVSQDFIKIYGGPSNGQWGYAGAVDGAPNNFPAKVSFSEAGRYTLQVAGRSQGFHIDWIELYTGNAPAVNAVDSGFIFDDSVSSPPPAKPIDPITGSAFTISLVDTASKSIVASLANNAAIDLGSETPASSRTIIADFTGPGSTSFDVGSIVFELFDSQGKLLTARTENVQPYALFGDKNGDFFSPASPLIDGSYSLSVEAFGNKGGNGPLLGSEMINFTLA